MPHVIVKLLAGRTDEQKARIAEEVTKAITATTGQPDDAVSVGIEDVSKRDWVESVYKPDIAAKPETLFKKPGYNPLQSASR